MKILHLSKYYPPDSGGIESFVRDLAEAQAVSGHVVRVLAHASTQFGGTGLETINKVGITRVRTWGQLAYAPVSPSFPGYIRSCFKAYQPDVLHVHMPNTSAFWLLFWPRLPKLVLHWHADVNSPTMPRKLKWLYRIYRPFERWLLFRAKRIIVTSRPYLESSLSLTQYKEKCVIVPLGLNPGRFLRQQERAGSASDPKRRFFVLAVGRFAYYKGFANLIRAVADLPEVYLCIAGQGETYPRMRRLVQDLGLSERVELPGSVSHAALVRLLQACDLFCLPSVERSEAFGMVLLEAMCCGKPVLTADIPGSGVSVVNQDGVTGLRVGINDPGALVRGIQTFIQNPAMREGMGCQACSRFQTQYHIQGVADLIEQAYCHVLPVPCSLPF